MTRARKKSGPVTREMSKSFLSGVIKDSKLEWEIISFIVDPLILLETGGIHVYPGQQISVSIVFEEGTVEVSEFLCQYIRQSQGKEKGTAHFVRVEEGKEYKLCAEVRLYEKEIKGEKYKEGDIASKEVKRLNSSNKT